MTADDYAIIRERLDHPQQSVWDPCAVTLAEDDPEWPAPEDFADAKRLMEKFLHRTRVRLCLVAAAMTLPIFERRSPSDARPRTAVVAVHSWVCRIGHVTMRRLEAAMQGAFAAAEPPHNAMSPARSAAHSISAICLPAHAVPAAYAVSSALPKSAEDFVAYDRWWARCRALLPIADVTTAEIEWGDIE